ncbi:MAG: adenylate/guanylate cyclase domain-containing protein [Allosphingosinicella sp.]
MESILPRFADPETERAFLRAERAGRGPVIRALIIVAVATLFSYIVLNPMHFSPDGLIAYISSASALIVLMIGFFLLTRTEVYLDRPWIDLPLFVAFLVAMKALALALAGEAPVTGFPPHVMVMVQMGILVVFASVGFAGTFRLFVVWASGVAALFGLWLATRDVSTLAKIYTSSNFSTFFLFALYFNWDMERRARKVFAGQIALEAERARTEALLYNVLPQEVVARLRSGEAVADAFSDVTVIFVDLVDFSRLAKRLSPGHLVELLNTFFSAADRAAERHGLAKVKTIGDAYLAVAGGMGSRAADCRAALAFARDLIAELEAMAQESGLALKARVGIHTGPVVGGVIGSSRLAYDYWGDTMNIASRLQGAAPPNGVALSEATFFQARAGTEFEPQTALLKGIGEVQIYVARMGD